jgi:hypothetical protein
VDVLQLRTARTVLLGPLFANQLIIAEEYGLFCVIMYVNGMK